MYMGEFTVAHHTPMVGDFNISDIFHKIKTLINEEKNLLLLLVPFLQRTLKALNP